MISKEVTLSQTPIFFQAAHGARAKCFLVSIRRRTYADVIRCDQHIFIFLVNHRVKFVQLLLILVNNTIARVLLINDVSR